MNRPMREFSGSPVQHDGLTQSARTVSRLEQKIPIDGRRLGLVRAWLAHRCVPAADYPAGLVSSCYYDTRDLDEYFASFDGDFEKNKVRLRWYGTLPADGEATAFIELKSKLGAHTTKQRIPLTLRAELLAEGRFSQAVPQHLLARHLLAFGYVAPIDLRPIAVITYHRYRFVEPQSQMRLSLDSDIRAWLACDNGSAYSMPLRTSVLELKGQRIEIPPRLRGLRRFGPIWSGYSKYANAVETLAAAPGPFQP